MLIVFDLNHVLIDVSGGVKNLVTRPFLSDFLDFCFENFDVGIWSSRSRDNVINILNLVISREHISKFLFIEGGGIIKKLSMIWDQYPEYNTENTLIFDDTLRKIIMNPRNNYVLLEPWHRHNVKDFSLNDGGDIRSYLELYIS